MGVTRCPQAYRYNAQDDTLRCRKMAYPNDCCGNVKFCRITSHWENTDDWKRCPMLKIQKTAEGENKNGTQV